MKGWIIQNENGTFQGPFCEELRYVDNAQILDRLNGIDKKRVHKLIPVEFEWCVGKKVINPASLPEEYQEYYLGED